MESRAGADAVRERRGPPSTHPIPDDGALGEAKLVRDNRTNQVLYLTVGKDFANLLITALSLPMSVLTKILAEAPYLRPVGCIGNIFRSLEGCELDKGAPTTDADREATDVPVDQERSPASPSSKSIVSPFQKKRKGGPGRKEDENKAKSVPSLEEEEHVWHIFIYKQLVMHHNMERMKNLAKRYRCPNAKRLQNCAIVVTEQQGKRCLQCKEPMTEDVVNTTSFLGCISDAEQVVFSDTLVITPLKSAHSLLELVMKKGLGNFTHYEMCSTTVGMKEVLRLVHAALTSSQPLTEVFSS